MKRLVIFLLLISCGSCFSQDKIITLAGDTLDCRLSTRPWKEGIRISRNLLRGQYGYYLIVATFSNDSTRVLYPWQIAGFYHHQHTRSLPGGYFEATYYQGKLNTLLAGITDRKEKTHGFFRRIYQSEYISVYDFVEEHLADLEKVLFFKKAGDSTVTYFPRRSAIQKVFNDTPGLAEQTAAKNFKYNSQAVIRLAEIYTRLKQSAKK